MRFTCCSLTLFACILTACSPEKIDVATQPPLDMFEFNRAEFIQIADQAAAAGNIVQDGDSNAEQILAARRRLKEANNLLEQLPNMTKTFVEKRNGEVTRKEVVIDNRKLKRKLRVLMRDMSEYAELLAGNLVPSDRKPAHIEAVAKSVELINFAARVRKLKMFEWENG